MPPRLPYGLVPYDGPPADMRGLVLTSRRVECAACGVWFDVVVVLTDQNEVAVLLNGEAARFLTS